MCSGVGVLCEEGEQSGLSPGFLGADLVNHPSWSLSEVS